jgi:eukaryotic-like serine/threonine-protein kinase
MSVADMATLTLVKIKEYTSTTLVKLTRGLTGTEFMKRSRRVFWGCFSLWLAANAVSFIVYHSAVSRVSEEFYRTGVSATQGLAQETRAAILDNDILLLNLALRAREKVQGFVYAAILDHQNQVLTRIGTEEAAHPLQPFLNQPLHQRIETVEVSGIITEGANDFILFLQPITYSNVDIGKAIVALSATDLRQDLTRAKWIYGAVIVALGLMLVGFVLWVDRRKIRKSEALAKRIQSIETLGPYQLISKVAQGGMAELYLADYLREDSFRRRVALKRILPHLAANEDFIQMFIREARLAALLQHPNIVQVFDYGKISDVSFIAMEYIDGKNLGQVISRMNQGLPVEAAVTVFSEICKGLDYSHTKVNDQTGEALNIVHRDISPQNILLSFQGEVKISDFGISKAITEPSLTQVGMIKGKLLYLAPEQLTGEPVDHRLDIYAMGLVFYQTLTGHLAYQFDSEVEAIKRIPNITIEPLRQLKPNIPEELDRIVMKCLEKNVATRYQSAASVLADLLAFKKNRRITFDSTDLSALLRDMFNPG